jgi:hypothetical protein
VKTIKLNVAGVSCRFELLEQWAPVTTSILWDALPCLGQQLQHGKWSSNAAFIVITGPEFSKLPQRNELPVRSIYPGYLVARLPSEDNTIELLLSYGTSEYRYPLEVDEHVTPIARIADDEEEEDAMLAAVERTWLHGVASVDLSRDE